MSASGGLSDRLRVLVAGFEIEPNVPRTLAGIPVDVVHRARTADEVAALAEAVGADVVLGDAALAEIACLRHSGGVALLRSGTAEDFVLHSGRAVHALAADLVETVLAVASIRAFCVAER
jgi:hypothetical protein